MADGRIPSAVYRLQFNQACGFAQAREIVPYLHALGITDLYASPLLAARRGSPHGYDVIDPARLNPELGDEDAFAALIGMLRRHGMGLLLDIVPNHMAAGTENAWWCDVLRNGQESPYAAYFDLDWRPATPGLSGKVLLPVLGAPFSQVLENGELTLALAEDGFRVCYGDQHWPLAPGTSVRLLTEWLAALFQTPGLDNAIIQALADMQKIAQEIPRPAGARELNTALPQMLAIFWRLYRADSKVEAFTDACLQRLNGRRGEPQSFARLEQILDDQAYRLSFWRLAREEINYRRFFDVSGLVSVRVEQEHVFAATHAFIARLAATGQVTGLRVDHIDGLRDPEQYLNRLQALLAGNNRPPSFFVVAEKILSNGETLPEEWPVFGTTGYDFMHLVNGLSVDTRGMAELTRLYARYSGLTEDYSTVVYQQKQRAMAELFAGEVRTLARQLGALAKDDRYGHDLTLAELEQAIVQVTACLPVYRTYIRRFTVPEQDRRQITFAVEAAARRCPASAPACNFLKRLLLLNFPFGLPPAKQQAWLDFVLRWQQFTGPVMAKGAEDTALYIYHRLVSLNEVGGEPQTTGIPVAEFHRRNQARQARWPHTMNATSTHDTKRSEDVRARINVLSEITPLWERRVDRWRYWNHPKKPVVQGRHVPDGNMEYLIYQTLVGAWPLREEEIPAFRRRLEDYLLKAAREAKLDTSWLEPAEDYEKALQNFVAAILFPAADNLFLQDFKEFQQVIAVYGALNSLAQTLLKITSPGLPDFYQNTEVWHFSLVDPDNRRPVDFRALAASLAQLQRAVNDGGPPQLLPDLLASWEDGRVKLYLIYQALHFRRAHQELFAGGEYIPVAAAGPQAGHVCAFARKHSRSWVLVAVPRLPARLCLAARSPAARELPATGLLLPCEVWQDSSLILDGGAPGSWRDIFTGEVLSVTTSAGDRAHGENILPLKEVFQNFPVALLAGGDT